MQEITATEAARRLGVTDKTLRKWIAAGKIAARRISETRLALNIEDVQSLAKERSTTVPDSAQAIILQKLAGIEAAQAEINRRLGLLEAVILNPSADNHPEKSKLQTHLYRAVESGLPATLTLEQWLATLDYFEWMCAYCRVKPYKVLEHFIPVVLDGGTTVDNCVPACILCNSRKGNIPPKKVRSIPREDMERVQTYLAGMTEPDI